MPDGQTRHSGPSLAPSTGRTRFTWATSWAKTNAWWPRARGASRATGSPPGDGGLPGGACRARGLRRDGGDGASGGDDPRGIRRARRGLRDLRPGRARGGADRQRIPVHDERAVEPRDVPDPCLWLRGATAEIPPRPRCRDADRLFRADGTGRGLRPRGDEDRREEDRGRLRPHRLQDVDLQRPHRRCLRGLGEVRSPWRQDPGLRSGEGHEGPLRAEDRRQAEPARLRHRRDRDGRGRGRRGCAPARGGGAERAPSAASTGRATASPGA
jgi:hypothetical protein